eukprot:1367891-Amphidinium_carterae.1
MQQQSNECLGVESVRDLCAWLQDAWPVMLLPHGLTINSSSAKYTTCFKDDGCQICCKLLAPTTAEITLAMRLKASDFLIQ